MRSRRRDTVSIGARPCDVPAKAMINLLREIWLVLTLRPRSGSTLLSLGLLGSIVVWVAAAGLFLASYDRPRIVTSWIFDGERHSLWAKDGSLRLMSPRAAPPGRTEQHQQPRMLFRTGTNWYLHCKPDGFFAPTAGRTLFIAFANEDTQSFKYGNAAVGPGGGDVVPLLRGLEDPDSFLHAHVALATRCGTENNIVVRDDPDGTCVENIDGLTVRLRRGQRYTMNRRPDTVMLFATAQADESQLPAIRRQWHDRLDRPAGSVSILWLLVVGAILCAGHFAAVVKGVRSSDARGFAPVRRCPSHPDASAV